MRRDYKNYIMTYKKEREKEIIKASIIGITASTILAALMVTVGYISNSIAIVLDGVEMISTALASIVIIIGIKLSSKKPDQRHPYGYGRLEYITDMIVAFIILAIGIAAFVTEIKHIINPTTPEYSKYTFIILSISMVVKFLIGRHEKHVSKSAHSRSLSTASVDSFANAIISLSIIISAIIFLNYGINIENYIGIAIAILIVRIAISLLKNTISEILGNNIHRKLDEKIKKTVMEFDEVLGTYDLVLHSYGRHKYIGTIYIEISSELSILEFEELQRNIIEKIYIEYSVIISAIGVYALNLKDEEFMKLYNTINEIADRHEEIEEVHGIFLDKEKKIICLDTIIDCNIKDDHELIVTARKELQEKYKDYKITIQRDHPLL